MLDLEDLEEIILLIQKLYGYDFTDYSKASMLRRVNLFMDNSRIASLFDLKYELVNNPGKFDKFVNEIVVNVSDFFRDPNFYSSLSQNVFPYLESYPKINVWSAGCSFGEEVYSMAIFLKEFKLLHKTRLYATDISANAIEKSKQGKYSITYFKDYSNNYFSSGGKESLKNYFDIDDNQMTISAELKKQILFSLHNLVTDGVFKECQLILCRNVLIYFNEELQDKVLKLFYESLPMHGFLALGCKESLRFSSVYENFVEVDKANRIYKKVK